MSEEVPANRSGAILLALYVGVPTVLLALVVVFILFSGPDATVLPKGPNTVSQENYLATVRTTLAKQYDLDTYKKTIVPLLNTHVQRTKEPAPQPLSTTTKDLLTKQLGLTADDLAEVDSPTFTPLDAHHLDQCFLLHAAARSLEQTAPAKAGKIKQTPLERAELAFAWAMREVRLPLARSATAAEPPSDPIPPAFVLRRGWGSTLERALVFLALLEQFGLEEDASASLQGVLLYCPAPRPAGAEGGPAGPGMRLWTCGVAIGDKPESLYLFDPRLGLPLPGKDGKGIATLAAAQSDPTILDQLQVEKVRYDVTAEQAKAAEVYLVCPLSTLAPRMRLLQDHFLRDRMWKDENGKEHRLPAAVRARLATDLSGARGSLQAAVKASGRSPEQLKLWPPGGTILRRFLPKEEGGSDLGQPILLRLLHGFTSPNDPAVIRLPRQHLFQMGLVPWQDFPRIFSHNTQFFRPDQGLGQDIRQVFAAPFLKPVMDSGSMRNLLLRGAPAKQVAPELVKEQRHCQQMPRLKPGEIPTGVKEWAERAVAVYAEAIRSRGTGNEGTAKEQVSALWKWKADDPIALLIQGSFAEVRGAEVTYQLALCKHEAAVRLQAKKDLAARNGLTSPEDAQKVDAAWIDAEGYWKEYCIRREDSESVEVYPDRPGVVSAQRWCGETQAMRGETKQAIRTWQKVSGPMTDLEKLACLWLAKQLAERTKGG